MNADPNEIAESMRKIFGGDGRSVAVIDARQGAITVRCCTRVPNAFGPGVYMYAFSDHQYKTAAANA